MSVDCGLCGSMTDETLAQHLLDRHLGVMLHIDYDPTRDHAVLRLIDEGVHET